MGPTRCQLRYRSFCFSWCSLSHTSNIIARRKQGQQELLHERVERSCSKTVGFGGAESRASTRFADPVASWNSLSCSLAAHDLELVGLWKMAQHLKRVPLSFGSYDRKTIVSGASVPSLVQALSDWPVKSLPELAVLPG